MVKHVRDIDVLMKVSNGAMQELCFYLAVASTVCALHVSHVGRVASRTPDYTMHTTMMVNRTIAACFRPSGLREENLLRLFSGK